MTSEELNRLQICVAQRQDYEGLSIAAIEEEYLAHLLRTPAADVPQVDLLALREHVTTAPGTSLFAPTAREMCGRLYRAGVAGKSEHAEANAVEVANRRIRALRHSAQFRINKGRGTAATEETVDLCNRALADVTEIALRRELADPNSSRWFA